MLTSEGDTCGRERKRCDMERGRALTVISTGKNSRVHTFAFPFPRACVSHVNKFVFHVGKSVANRVRCPHLSPYIWCTSLCHGTRVLPFPSFKTIGRCGYGSDDPSPSPRIDFLYLVPADMSTRPEPRAGRLLSIDPQLLNTEYMNTIANAVHGFLTHDQSDINTVATQTGIVASAGSSAPSITGNGRVSRYVCMTSQ